MRKVIYIVILILVMALRSGGFQVFATDVGGIINTDTIWNLAGSPYTIVSKIQVAEGVTLTLEPGVKVVRSSSSSPIELWGKLIAIGNESSMINLEDVSLIKMADEQSINIEYAILQNTYIQGAGYIEIRYSNLYGGQIYIWRGYIEKNIFDKSSIHIKGGPTIVKNNAFYYEYSPASWTIGLDAYTSDTTIENNSFLNTDATAIRVGFGDVEYEILTPNNYWSTTDTDVIDGMIYDKFDDLMIAGYINYLPILTNTHPDTPYYVPNLNTLLNSIETGDFNNDDQDDLVGVTTLDQVNYSINLATWTNIPGEFKSIVTGDFNGDGDDDIAGVNDIGQVWYTTDMISWTNIPGTVKTIVTGDLDGDGDDDIAGINPAGMISKIFYTTNLSTWTPIPGLITSIVTGDLDGDGDDDIAGINPDGVMSKIFYTTDLSTWTPIPGLITSIVTGDLDGDGDYDIAGINPNGVMSKIFYTTDLSTWTPIPGLITSIVAGDFDGDGDDDIAGINPNGVSAKIFYTNDLVNWNIIPGALDMITTGDLNADGRDDLAGINSSGMTWYTTDLATWTNIP